MKKQHKKIYVSAFGNYFVLFILFIKNTKVWDEKPSEIVTVNIENHLLCKIQSK